MACVNTSIALYKKIRSMTDDEFDNFINEQTAFDIATKIEMGMKDVTRLNDDVLINPASDRLVYFSVVVGKSKRIRNIMLQYPVNMLLEGIAYVAKLFAFTFAIQIDLSNCEEYKEWPFIVCKYENGKLVEKTSSPTSMIA